MRDFIFFFFLDETCIYQQPNVYCDRRVFRHPTAKVKACAAWIWPPRHWRLQKHLHSLHSDSAHLFWPKLVVVLQVDKHTDSGVRIRSLSVHNTRHRLRHKIRCVKDAWTESCGSITPRLRAPSRNYHINGSDAMPSDVFIFDMWRGKACIQKRESSAQWKNKALKNNI